MATDEESAYDPFKGESGFKDDYDGTIVDAYFDPGDLGTQLILKINADDGEEVESRYACGGTDWTTYDGGETVEHPKGNTKGFNKNSKMFRLIDAAMSCGGDAETTLRARAQQGPVKDGVPLGPKSAAIWKGLKFHWMNEEKPYEFKDRQDETKTVKGVAVVSLPKAYLGEGVAAGNTATSGLPGPSSAPPASSTAQTPSAPTPTPTPTSLSIDPAMKVKLMAAAKKADDHSTFCDLAMEIDGVVENEAVMAAIVDEGFFAGMKG